MEIDLLDGWVAEQLLEDFLVLDFGWRCVQLPVEEEEEEG